MMKTIMNNKSYRVFFYIIIILLWVMEAGNCIEPDARGQAYQQKINGKIFIAIRLNLAKDESLYHTDLGDTEAVGMPLQIALSNDAYYIDGFATSKPKIKIQESFSEPGKTFEVNIHTDIAYIYLLLENNQQYSLEKSMLQGKQGLKVYVRGQICNKQRCLQLALALPVAEGAASAEAAEMFALMPELSQFTKPLPDWSKFSEDKRKSQDAAIANVGNSCKFKNLFANSGTAGASLQDIPSLAAIADNMQNDGSIEAELPKFNIRQDTVKYGLIAWLGIALLAGVLLNFMPCVLPVISLKLMGFVNQAHESRKRLLLLSLCFSAGIITVFLVLALAAVVFGLQWGEQFQSETFNIILVCLVFAFALSFFNVYELEVPEIAGKLQGDGGLPREGYLGTFCTGILATLMATPCSGPFLGATISWALTQTAFTVIAVFLFLGIGMALPYFLLSLSSFLRKFLPKPGGWMITFRVSMGFVLLLTVIYLMLFIKADNLLATCSLMIFIAFSCWIFGKYATILHSKKIRWLTRFSAMVIIVLGVYLSFGVFKPVFSRSALAQGEVQASLAAEQSSDEKGRVAPQPFDFTAFHKDLSSGKNILVDFTADWCPNCKYNSHYVFAANPVLDMLNKKNVVFYEADLTDDNPQTEKLRDLLKSLGGSAIPYVGLFPADAPESPYVLPDILTVAKVVDALDKLPNSLAE